MEKTTGTATKAVIPAVEGTPPAPEVEIVAKAPAVEAVVKAVVEEVVAEPASSTSAQAILAKIRARAED